MVTKIENNLISKHMMEYAKLIHAEAEKLEILGITATPSLYDKADEIYYLAEQISDKFKVVNIESYQKDKELKDNQTTVAE